MSKFLKFIVHLVILVTVVGVLALVVPPFAGIDTTVIDSARTETNLPFGSVTYARTVPIASLQTGDSIVYRSNGSVYSYEIQGIQAEEGIYQVEDAGGTKDLALSGRAPRVIVTIPFLGYLLVAVQSVEGLVILGLVLLFLIILYIIAELWRKEPKEQEEFAEDGHLKTPKELKQEEKARKLQMKEEERQMLKEEKARKKAEKKRRKAMGTGGFVDDVEEDYDYEGEDTAPEEAYEPEPAPAAVELPKGPTLKEMLSAEEETAAAAPEPEPVEEPAATAEEEMAEPEPAPSHEEEWPTEPVVYQKMVIPRYTVSELQQKAEAAGDHPDIYQDSVSGVTLFDYSQELMGGSGEKK